MLVNAWAGAELDFLVTWHTQWGVGGGGGGGGVEPLQPLDLPWWWMNWVCFMEGSCVIHHSVCVLQTDCAREDVGGIETDIHIPAEDHSADAASAGIRRKYCVYCIGGWEGVEGGGVSLW